MPSTPQQVSLSLEELVALCPYHVAMNAAGVITRVGRLLADAAPAVRPGGRLDSVVHALSPSPGAAGAGAAPSEAPETLGFAGSTLQLRGRFHAAGPEFCFVGTPVDGTLPPSSTTPPAAAAVLLFETLPLGLALVDDQRRTLFANSRCRALLASTPLAEMLARLPREHAAGAAADLPCLRNGETRHLRLTTFPVPAGAEAPSATGVLLEDVTAATLHEAGLQRSLAQLREDRALSHSLLSVAGHEFRTPLTAIGGTLFLLREALKDPRNLSAAKLALIEKWFGLQNTAVNTMKTTVEQVLALNRIAFDADESAFETVHPGDIAHQVIEAVGQTTPDRQVTLDDATTPDFLARFNVGLIRRAMENVLTNALKFSAPETVVRARLWAEGDSWVLEVADEGRGIPEVDQARIFTPFFRASNVHHLPGSGLGLATVARAVRHHGGSVSFESVENRGTHVFLRVPRRNAPAAPAPESTGRPGS